MRRDAARSASCLRTRPIVWLFDLDNTLHDASHAVFPHLNRGMTDYIVQQLNLNESDANALRIHYWQRYGATLLGLLRHHAIDADHFLHHTHQFDDLPAMLRAERGLRQMLAQLPGRKVLLTNAPDAYAQQVLLHLGLHRNFQRCYAVEHMRLHGHYRPKPSRMMLRALVRRERTHASRCVLVEDTLENLRYAKACGLATVWVCGYATQKPRAPLRRPDAAANLLSQASPYFPQYVDLKIQSVRTLSRRIRALRSLTRKIK